MTTDLCTREEIRALVDDFYEAIRTHETLGPIFNTHIQDWPTHLNTMLDFWSAIVLKTGGFSGSAMMKHAAIPNLSAELFEQWLALFEKPCAERKNRALGDAAWLFAQRIARSLWMGYQIQQQPNQAPTELRLRTLQKPDELS